MRIVDSVRKFIVEHKLFQPGERIIVGFSGGADSTALLHILTRLSDFPLEIIAVHINHLLRGEESDGDEQFARQMAGNLGVEFESFRVDAAKHADEQRLSLEEAGREIRRKILQEAVARHSGVAIVLAHHIDDQAETVLMRLLRGSGASGLRGMLPRSGLFVRPLLEVSRGEIETYLQENHIAWREDRSNSETIYLRNRIRHELLPLLATYNPEVKRTLARVAGLLTDDEEVLESAVQRLFAVVATVGADSVVIDLTLLRDNAVALRRRVYRKAIEALQGDLRRITADHLAAVDRLALGYEGGAVLDLPAAIFVRREYDSLTFCLKGEGVNAPHGARISGFGSYDLAGGATISVEPFDGAMQDMIIQSADTVFIDTLRHPFPWQLRYFENGDRMTPFGMVGSKKLKNIFIDKKIPQPRRALLPLLLKDNEILWVAGVQCSENCRVDSDAKAVARVTIKPGDQLQSGSGGVD